MKRERKLIERQRRVMLASLKNARVRVSAKLPIAKIRALYTATFKKKPPSLTAMNQKWWYQRNVILRGGK